MTETLSPLEQAQDIIDKIYEITSALNYTGGGDEDSEEAEMNAYMQMVEAREPLVQALVALQEQLDATMRATPEFVEITRCIADITDMNASHASYFNEMQDELRKSIKEIKKGRRVHSAYNVDVNYDDASYVDTKK